MSETVAREAIMSLLGKRDLNATLCPSEAARIIAADAGRPDAEDAWREAMPRIHQAVDSLLEDGLITLSWKGQPLARRTGPYRISAAGALRAKR